MLGVSPGFVPVGNSAGLGRRRSFVPEQHFAGAHRTGRPRGRVAVQHNHAIDRVRASARWASRLSPSGAM